MVFVQTKSRAQFFAQKERLVEVSGIVVTSDSTQYVPNVVISVLHQNRGVMSNESGIFSLVCHPGDTLSFASVGYRTSRFVLPAGYSGQYYNRVQLMQQDTFFLPETTIHALPTGKEFVYAFKYWPVEPSIEDMALARFSKGQMSYLQATIPMNGAENSSYYQQQQAINGQYYGQVRNGVGLLSPLSWKQFFDAWKRGDFRKK
ncbi:MAG TPA: carboxypeptidase-like regulatory domain-containing protein [Edaphocola sp.]|nr:carboxypeptidase-like regulatory domain-containing protein [Edaphocola sp.]